MLSWSSNASEAGIKVKASALSVERRSEEHTSELQSPCNLVCRLLLEKKRCRDDGALLRRQIVGKDLADDVRLDVGLAVALGRARDVARSCRSSAVARRSAQRPRMHRD